MISNLLNDDIIIIVDMIRQNASETEILETIKRDFAMTDEQARNVLSQIKKQLENDTLWLELRQGTTLIR